MKKRFIILSLSILAATACVGVCAVFLYSKQLNELRKEFRSHHKPWLSDDLMDAGLRQSSPKRDHPMALTFAGPRWNPGEVDQILSRSNAVELNDLSSPLREKIADLRSRYLSGKSNGGTPVIVPEAYESSRWAWSVSECDGRHITLPSELDAITAELADLGSGIDAESIQRVIEADSAVSREELEALLRDYPDESPKVCGVAIRFAECVQFSMPAMLARGDRSEVRAGILSSCKLARLMETVPGLVAWSAEVAVVNSACSCVESLLALKCEPISIEEIARELETIRLLPTFAAAAGEELAMCNRSFDRLRTSDRVLDLIRTWTILDLDQRVFAARVRTVADALASPGAAWSDALVVCDNDAAYGAPTILAPMSAMMLPNFANLARMGHAASTRLRLVEFGCEMRVHPQLDSDFIDRMAAQARLKSRVQHRAETTDVIRIWDVGDREVEDVDLRSARDLQSTEGSSKIRSDQGTEHPWTQAAATFILVRSLSAQR